MTLLDLVIAGAWGLAGTATGLLAVRTLRALSETRKTALSVDTWLPQLNAELRVQDAPAHALAAVDFHPDVLALWPAEDAIPAVLPSYRAEDHAFLEDMAGALRRGAGLHGLVAEELERRRSAELDRIDRFLRREVQAWLFVLNLLALVAAMAGLTGVVLAAIEPVFAGGLF